MRISFWPYSVDTHELFTLLVSDPRTPKTKISKHFNVNPKTGEIWLEEAIKRRIIIPPVLRKRSFLNFREYFYFLRVEHPHIFYEKLQENKDITYFSVQSGFSNFQVIAGKPLHFDEEVVLNGPRSDYYVSIPPRITIDSAISQIEKKLQNLTRYKEAFSDISSPLLYHDTTYQWDDMDELIYRELSGDIRKPLDKTLKKVGSYSDRMWNWIKKRDEFGQTIIMYFPEGEGSYLLSVYCIDTPYDSLLIDIFSSLPTSTVFYRIHDKFFMCAYLPFSPEGKRYIIKKALATLWKKELVKSYTNSIVEYGYRD